MKDAIIVLAGGINQDGSLPDVPKSRVHEGVRRVKNGDSEVLVMTGKYGFWLDNSGNIPPRSEASAMREHAEALGVPTKNILIEEDSKDTLGNAYFTKVNILEPHNWRNVVVVTSDFHLTRTKFLFDFILGPDYRIEYAPVNTNFSTEKMEELRSREDQSLKILKKILGIEIKAGNTDAIRAVLFSKHPGYATSPEYSYEDLRKLLESE